MGEAEAYRRSKLLVWFSGNLILKNLFQYELVGDIHGNDRTEEETIRVSQKNKKKTKKLKILEN